MAIYTYITEIDFARWDKVSDKELNELIQEARQVTGIHFLVREHSGIIKRLVHANIYYVHYSLFIPDKNERGTMEARYINFAPHPQSLSSINTLVEKHTLMNYLMGIISGYQYCKHTTINQ